VDGASLAKLMQTDKREYTFAQTFPTGTHAMWLYYWLATYGINPMKDAKVITVPPPQMVANMRVGNMDGFCVGEPWNHRAIVDGVGITATTTQDIWKRPSGKSPRHHAGMGQEISEHGARPDCRGARSEQVDRRRPVEQEQDGRNHRRQVLCQHLGRRDQPAHPGPLPERLGKTWDDPNYMKFYNDGAVNFPYLSDGMWFMTQHKRWGLLKGDPDYLAVAKSVNQIALYKDAATWPRPACRNRRDAHVKLIDGTVWDGKNPKAYAARSRSRPERLRSQDRWIARHLAAAVNI
jgi:nitrate/nitrite transport system substrate-binding protein